MSKTIEFKVEYYQVGLNRTKTESRFSKNLDRLLSSMPKPMKKKWKTITYTEKGKVKTFKKEQDENTTFVA
jgi:hypothetical protein